jgi:hypothetical protein
LLNYIYVNFCYSTLLDEADLKRNAKRIQGILSYCFYFFCQWNAYDVPPGLGAALTMQAAFGAADPAGSLAGTLASIGTPLDATKMTQVHTAA